MIIVRNDLLDIDIISMDYVDIAAGHEALFKVFI